MHINPYDYLGKCQSNTMFNSKFEIYTSADSQMFLADTLEEGRAFFTASDYTPFYRKHLNDPKHLQFIPECVFGVPIVNYLGLKSVR